MNSTILVQSNNDFKYLFIGPKAFVRGFCIDDQILMNSSIIIQSQSIDFNNVQIFAFATMFEPADVFDVYIHLDDYGFDCLLVSEPEYYFIVCY